MDVSGEDLGAASSAFYAQIGGQIFVCCLDPFGQERARFSRIDYFFDAEGFCRSVGGSVLLQGVFNFLAPCIGIGRRLDVASVGGLHAAFYGERTPVARGPCVTQVQAFRISMARARNTLYAPDKNGTPGNGCLVNGDERVRAHSHRAVSFGFGAD